MEVISLMFLCRLCSVNCSCVKLIGTNLHNLEELFLGVGEQRNENSDVIKCLVTGCPNLRILHVKWNVTVEAVQYMLLGLPNLAEFKHRLMVLALEKIIQDGSADRVSAIRTLCTDESYYNSNISVKDVLKSASTVMRDLNNITKLDIKLLYNHSKISFTTFYATVSNMTQLTELTLRNDTNDTVHLLPIIEAIGHQLKVLDCCYQNDTRFDVISQCRKLRVLRIRVFGNTSNMNDQSYGSDLREEFTPFYHLQKIHLNNITNAHLNSALLKSLIASPVLQELQLVWTHIVTDDILKAAFNHVNEEGEQLAFTSLRTCILDKGFPYNFNTNYFLRIVTHERVPLEVLVVYGKEMISKIARRKLERFDIEIIEERNLDIGCFFPLQKCDFNYDYIYYFDSDSYLY